MMVKTRNTEDGDTSSATKAIWDDELTRIFCELCVKEVEAGNRPTTHLNGKGWENVTTAFNARTQKNYGRNQLKNKWDTLKKEWKLWTELLKDSTSIGWCPIKKTLDATKEWWTAKLQENEYYKMFKKRGIEPHLNALLWQMFSDTVATGEFAWAPSSGVLPGGASGENVTPVEGFGDSNENESEQEDVPINEIGVGASLETSNRCQRLGVVQGKSKKLTPVKKSVGKTLTTQIEKLCDGMSSPRKSDNEIAFPPTPYGFSNALNALRSIENEIPRKSHLHYFAIKLFQVAIKREVFLSLEPDLRAWWIQCEYEEQNVSTRFTPLLPTPPPHAFQQFQPTPPPHAFQSFQPAPPPHGFQPFQQTPPPPVPPGQ